MAKKNEVLTQFQWIKRVKGLINTASKLLGKLDLNPRIDALLNFSFVNPNLNSKFDEFFHMIKPFIWHRRKTKPLKTFKLPKLESVQTCPRNLATIHQYSLFDKKDWLNFCSLVAVNKR